MVLSDHMAVDFNEKYGVLIKEQQICCRVVSVINRENKVTYVAYMPVLNDEHVMLESLRLPRRRWNEGIELGERLCLQ